jgi:glutathione gamma-glutamylcysteinyltransferase
MTSFHKRPLPDHLVAFGSVTGRRMLAQSMAAGDAEAFFPLVSHLHTQSEPAWCGLGTMVTVLNALEIDPGRVWKGPWRFFGEELLQCCKSLELTAMDGVTLAEVACIALCNGASVQMQHAAEGGEAAFRQALLASVRAPEGPFVVANYDRASIGQTGTGHFSPLAAWHADSDSVLVLDVARFKYPPHWVPVADLWNAMFAPDNSTGQPRGYLLVGKGTGIAPPVAGVEAMVERLQGLGAKLCCPATALRSPLPNP